MTSKRKVFEFNDDGIKIEVNQESNKVELTWSYGDFDTCSHFIYQYRIKKDSIIEIRLLEAREWNHFDRVVKIKVKNGVIDEGTVLKVEVAILKVDIEWHALDNEVIQLCILHDNKEATSLLRAEIRNKLNTLNASYEKIFTTLKNKFGADLLDQGSDRISVKVDEDDARKEHVDEFFNQDSKDFGISNWSQFLNYPLFKLRYQKLLGDGLILVSSDVWSEEAIRKKIEHDSQKIQKIVSTFKSKFSKPISRLFSPHQFVKNLESLFEKYPDNNFEELAEDYFEIVLEIVDSIYVCSADVNRKYGQVENWFLALDKASLELTTRSYLNKSWQCSGVDHFILGAFIGHENDSLHIEMQPVLNFKVGFFANITRGREISEIKAKATTLLSACQQLYDAALSSHVSTSGLRDLVFQTKNAGVFVHPYVLTIIDRCLERGVKEFKRT